MKRVTRMTLKSKESPLVVMYTLVLSLLSGTRRKLTKHLAVDEKEGEKKGKERKTNLGPTPSNLLH